MAAAMTTESNNKKKKKKNESVMIERSFGDDRLYEYFVLDANQLRVLLIHDPSTTQSAASLDVAIGQYADPSSMQGCAHFCEHLLFMGTTKYPDENDYQRYLTTHGGHSNAYTDLEHTNYYFCVKHDAPDDADDNDDNDDDPDTGTPSSPFVADEGNDEGKKQTTTTTTIPALRGALDRFCQFFISPLFDESSVDRERKAVHSEFEKNVQSDPWRLDQFLKSRVPNRDHPHAGFGSGNASTLEGDASTVRQTVMDFYQQYYSANLMTLVVYGKESLETLKAWVQEYASDIPNHNYSSPVIPSNPFYPQCQPASPSALVAKTKDNGEDTKQQQETFASSSSTFTYYKIVPVQATHSLDMYFPMRETQSLYKSKPTQTISHLLGHEGKGSLLSFLKQKGWAQELSASGSVVRPTSSWGMFGVSIQLTPSGLDQWSRVVTAVFSYIVHLLQRSNTFWPKSSLMVAQTDSQGMKDEDDTSDLAWIHAEAASVENMGFQFKSRMEPMDYVSFLALNMHNYIDDDDHNPAHVLSGPYKLYDYEPQYVYEIVQHYLVPSNLLLVLSSPTFEGQTSQTEHWYGTPYQECELMPNDTMLEQWKNPPIEPALTLPERNDMIATNFDLVYRKGITKNQGSSSNETADTDENDKKWTVDSFPKARPVLLQDSTICRLWYKLDNVFDMPKANVLMRFLSPVAYMESPKSAVMASLLQSILSERTNEFTYLASMAGLHSYISASRVGLELTVSGYNHHLDKLLQRWVTALMDFGHESTNESDEKDAEALLERLKMKLMEQFQNIMMGAQPYQHALYGADLILLETKYTIEERMAILAGNHHAKETTTTTITLQDLRLFHRRIMEQFHLEVLVHGNVTVEQAKTWIQESVLDRLQPMEPYRTSLPEDRVVQIGNPKTNPPSSTTIYQMKEYNPDTRNSVVENIYDMGGIDLEENAVLAMLNHLIKEPAFHQLRTEEQLGYIVHNSVNTAGGHVKGLMILVQSDGYDPIYLDERVEAFLTNFRQLLVQMSPEEYQMNVQAVVRQFLEKDHNLSEESGKYWGAITKNHYQFDRLHKLAYLVQSQVTKLDVLRFFDRYVAPNGRSRSKLSVQVFARQHVDKMMTKTTTAPTEGEDVPVKQKVEGETIKYAFDPIEFKRTASLYPLQPIVDVSVYSMEKSVGTGAREQESAVEATQEAGES